MGSGRKLTPSQSASLQPVGVACRMRGDFLKNLFEPQLRIPPPIAAGVAAVHDQPGDIVGAGPAIGFGLMFAEARVAPGVEIGERDGVLATAARSVQTLAARTSALHLAIEQRRQIAGMKGVPYLFAGPIETQIAHRPPRPVRMD